MNTHIEQKKIGETSIQQERGAGGKIATALIIGLIVGFVAGVFWQNRRISPITDDTDKTEESEKISEKGATDDVKSSGIGGFKTVVTEPATSTVRLVLKNQIAGDKVVVEEAAVNVPTWIAVREDTAGKPGNILGAQKVFSGVSRDVVVELLRPTVPSAKYHTLLYLDAGSPAFNYREDILIQNVDATFETKAL